ncbi:MAG: Vms1/Ankzf1 family peptidyl-tRNA hydrolase [Chloroflexi bacterium]|nr:Vms1/Ankzf1 family peptidyl-tRNA hydrolase [Chloroflexota bacterium]
MLAQVVERHWTSKARLLRLLTEVDEGDWCTRSVYLRPESLNTPADALPDEIPAEEKQMLAGITNEIGPSDTGVVAFMGEGKATAVLPPFPLKADSHHAGANTAQLRDLLERQLVTGVVLLRLGRYAVAVLRGEILSATKTDTRHVKNRHRAGGSSQRRFMRSRDRLIRELYDKTCEVVRDVFEPFGNNIDYVLLGGEKNTLRDFQQRCRLMQDLGPKVLSRTLQMDRPNHEALQSIAFEVWKSRVLTFELA